MTISDLLPSTDMDYFVVMVGSAVMFVTGTCGLVGNALTMRAVHNSQNDRSTFYAMLLLLTMSGSLQVVQVMGLQMYEITAASVHKVVFVSAMINCTGSIVLLTVAVLAVNRYLSVRKKVRFCISDMCAMFMAGLAVTIGSLLTTPWASFIVPASQCTDKVVVVAEVFSFVCGLVIVGLTILVTCAMSKCIVKADSAVADLQSRRNTGTSMRINFRQNIRCGKAMRWLIFEELFAYTCLSSIMLVSLIYFQTCRVSISDCWWYRLLQVFSVSSKPVLLTLVSKVFRRAVLASNVLQDAEMQCSNLYNFEEDCLNTEVSRAVVRMTDNESVIGATSIDSNHLANDSNRERISLATVTTFQGMKYPFPASVSSSNATDSNKQETSAGNSPDLHPEASSVATINISPSVLDGDAPGNNSSVSSGEHESTDSSPCLTDGPGTAVSNMKVSRKQKLSQEVDEVDEKMRHSDNLKNIENYDSVDSITLDGVLCPSRPRQLLDSVLDQRRDSGVETIPCPNVTSLPPLASQTPRRLPHMKMIQAIPNIVLTDDEQVSTPVLEVNASPFFERSLEINTSHDENLTSLPSTNIERIQPAHKWQSDQGADVLMHDTCNVVDGIDLLPDGPFFRTKSKQRRYSLEIPRNIKRPLFITKSLAASIEDEGLRRRMRSLDASSTTYNGHVDSNNSGHLDNNDSGHVQTWTHAKNTSKCPTLLRTVCDPVAKGRQLKLAFGVPPPLVHRQVISGTKPKLPPIQRHRLSSGSQDSVNSASTSLSMYDSDSHVYLGPLHRH